MIWLLRRIDTIGRAWYGFSPRDRQLLARLVAVVIALGATHSVVGAMLAFAVIDWLLE